MVLVMCGPGRVFGRDAGCRLEQMLDKRMGPRRTNGTRRPAVSVRHSCRRFGCGRTVASSPRIRYHLGVFILNFQIRGRTAMPIQQISSPRLRIAFVRRRTCVSDPCVGFDP